MGNERFIEEKKRTPVRQECDVLIVGGGTAGIVAALAAARNGADTVLVERYGHLGGTMIHGAGPWHSYFNLWKAFPGVEKKQVVRGIAQEIVDRMVESDGSLGHVEMDIGFAYDSVATIVDREVFMAVAFEMIKEAGVKLLLHTLMTDVVMGVGSVEGIIVESVSGREAILAKTIVDTSGDATVAFMAGVHCTVMADDGSVGMPFGMTNVDLNKAVEFLKEKDMLTQLGHADKGSDRDDIVRIGFNLKKHDVFRDFMEKTTMWGPLTVSRHEDDLSFINTASVKPINAVDVDAVTEAEVELRRQVMGMAALLKKHIPGFEKAYVSWTCRQLGVRRTRIVACEHDLSVDEIVEGKRFDDEIALYGFHDSAPRIMIKEGRAYGIPYRALLPKGVENLLVAGRMITSDFEAHMSTRNTVSCMAQGQAAGTAAAISSKSGVTPRKLEVKILQQTLVKDGVYLEK